MSRSVLPVIIPAIAAFAVLALSSCGNGSSSTAPAETGSYLNWSPDAKPTGKAACGECHQENYSTYLRSQMGRSWRKATFSNSNAVWDDADPIYDETMNLWYQPFRMGEDLFVQEYRLVDGDTIHSRTERIDWIVGSGQHTNSHIYDENGYLFQIPVTYYTQDGFWDLAPGFRQLNGRFGRPLPEECLNCHNGKPVFVPGSENQYAFVPDGIDCEQCHGPGSIHDTEMRAGRVVDIENEIDYTIVHPGKLPPERLNDICRRCHLQGVETFKPGKGPPDFRPGQSFESFGNVYWPRQPDSASQFVMAFHPDRMAMSECYRASLAQPVDSLKMTCISCHNPHVDIHELDEDYYDNACLACHQEAPQTLCTEPSVVAGTQEAACFSCHMPEAGSTDIPHIRITDHYIRKPAPEVALTEQEMEAQREFLRLQSLVDPNPTPADRAEGFLSYYERVTDRPGMLDSAAVLLRQARTVDPTVDIGQLQVRLWYLQEDYSRIRGFIRENPPDDLQDAWTQYRIGEAFAQSGDVGLAINHFSEAVSLAPANIQYRERLGRAYVSVGDIEEAIHQYDAVLALHPRHDVALNNRGYARLLMGEMDGAESDYAQAAALNPDNEVALASLASIYFNTGRFEEAKRITRRLMRMSPGNMDYERLWDALASESDE